MEILICLCCRNISQYYCYIAIKILAVYFFARKMEKKLALNQRIVNSRYRYI